MTRSGGCRFVRLRRMVKVLSQTLTISHQNVCGGDRCCFVLESFVSKGSYTAFDCMPGTISLVPGAEVEKPV